MAIRLKNGSIFLHVPKTGGVWCEHVLRNSGLVEQPAGHRHSDFLLTHMHRRLGTGRELVKLAVDMAYARLRGKTPPPGIAIYLLLCAPSFVMVRILVGLYVFAQLETLGSQRSV